MPTDALFDVPESLSPYDQWLKRHRIVTDGDENGWIAYIDGNMDAWADGDTEDEAIARLCETLNIPLFGADETKRKGN